VSSAAASCTAAKAHHPSTIAAEAAAHSGGRVVGLATATADGDGRHSSVVTSGRRSKEPSSSVRPDLHLHRSLLTTVDPNHTVPNLAYGHRLLALAGRIQNAYHADHASDDTTVLAAAVADTSHQNHHQGPDAANSTAHRAH
jgi:hypothetical protein